MQNEAYKYEFNSQIGEVKNVEKSNTFDTSLEEKPIHNLSAFQQSPFHHDISGQDDESDFRENERAHVALSSTDQLIQDVEEKSLLLSL